MGVGVNVERVPADILEVVVDAVEEDLRVGVVGAHVRRAAGHIMQPVAREGVLVVLADQKQSPVMLSIAARRPLGAAVKLVVRDGDASGLAPAANNVLTTGQGELIYRQRGRLCLVLRGTHLVVVNPDLVRFVERQRISAPDVLRVQVLPGVSYLSIEKCIRSRPTVI